MSPRRRLLVPALTAAIMLAILIGLGLWQVRRLAWKTGIIDAITAAERAPPIPLGPRPAEFTKVSATGVFRGDLAATYGAEARDARNGGSVLGGYLIQPLIRPGQKPILVDRGWIDDHERDAAAKLAAGVDKTVVGYIREPDRPGMFSATDDLKARRFYTLDPAAIGHALGLDDVEPYTLVALGPLAPVMAGGELPDPAQSLPRPTNNHFQYALTWFGFAVTLLIIFFIYARKVLRNE